RIRFPTLAACHIRWVLARDDTLLRSKSAPRKSDWPADLIVHDEPGDGPHDPQRSAMRFVLENQEQIASNVCSELLREVSTFTVPALQQAEALGLLSIDGIQELVELCAIHFLEETKDKESYITVDFGCCWDEEHGISVLMHHGRVVAISGD